MGWLVGWYTYGCRIGKKDLIRRDWDRMDGRDVMRLCMVGRSMGPCDVCFVIELGTCEPGKGDPPLSARGCYYSTHDVITQKSAAFLSPDALPGS